MATSVSATALNIVERVWRDHVNRVGPAALTALSKGEDPAKAAKLQRGGSSSDNFAATIAVLALALQCVDFILTHRAKLPDFSSPTVDDKAALKRKAVESMPPQYRAILANNFEAILEALADQPR